jgi:PTH1 family peptidyl-tRNA hydrolase
MNLSGRAVQGVAQFYKVLPAEMLIVFDDLALPLGQLRLRPEGSAGGQNGMQSVIEHLGTEAVPRLRVGIGAAREGDMVDHVLGKFTPAEQAAMASAVDRAADAVAYAALHGLSSAMNIFNRAALESATPHPTTRQST